MNKWRATDLSALLCSSVFIANCVVGQIHLDLRHGMEFRHLDVLGQSALFLSSSTDESCER